MHEAFRALGLGPFDDANALFLRFEAAGSEAETLKQKVGKCRKPIAREPKSQSNTLRPRG
jgi:hypothetical protein